MAKWASLTNCCCIGESVAAFCSSSPVSTFGTVESHMMTMKMRAVSSQVHVGFPLRAWVVLNQWRMVTPIRKTSAAMIQLNCVAKASG
ncbi:hypothetical protein D3C78_1378910 [compost metagenome]